MDDKHKKQALEELFQDLRAERVPYGKSSVLVQMLQVLASQTDCEEIVNKIIEYCDNIDWTP